MYYLGIDLGGTFIKAGIVDENGGIIRKDSIETELPKGVDHVVERMGEISLKVIADAGLKVSDIGYAGVAAPGQADNQKGIMIYCSSIPFLNYPLAERISALTGIKKVYIENDANAAAKGESAVGEAKGYKNSIMITIGTGIGGGFIIDGKLYAGFNFAAAEVGHMVIDHNGPECQCGRKGCWEKLASATALIKTAREEMANHPDSVMWKICKNNLSEVNAKTPFDAKRQGDAAGTKVVDRFTCYLALGLTNLINLLQPEIITIGGGVSNEGDYLLDGVRKIVEKEQYSRHGEHKTKILKAALGNDAGIIGAAMLGK
ncbi:MAG: ROK family protein [Clostridiales bacterium]|jgi:glucokinase|nr:ROK family protein [Clostridiales bacterium]